MLVPPFQGSPVLMAFLSGSSIVAILVGVRRNRPGSAAPWLLFALAQLLFFLGDVYTYVYPMLIGHDVPFPSFGDAFYLAQYPALMLGILLIVRRRNPYGDRAGVIDAVMITVGIGLLSWVFLIAPYVNDATLGALAKAVSVAYPVGDVLLVAALLRLLFDGGRRPAAFNLLVASGAALFLTDAAYGYALLDGSYHHQLIYDAGWIAYYLLWGSVALDPTMRNLTEATVDRERRLTTRRLAFLTTASLLAPAVEIVRESGSGNVDLLVVEGATMVLVVLVILRVVGLARQHERAVARERTLGEASAALVAAGSDTTALRAAMQQAATTLVSAAGQVRLVTAAAGGLSLIEESRSLSRLSARVVSQIEAAADASVSGLLDREARAALDLSERTACAAVFLAGEAPARGGVVVGSPEPLSPVIARALQTLVGAAGLALGSALATEATHRLQAEARLGSLVRNASDLITVVDTDGAIVYQSPSIARILGYAADDVSGKPFAALLAPRDRGRLAEVLAAGTVGGAEPHTFECLLRHEDGRAIDFEVLATDFLDDEQVRGIVLNGRDISERKALEARIAHQAFHDLVTGLPNRALFDDRVQHALAGLDRERETVGVIFLDLDDFKTVNDSLGHAAGDDVLREIARRLTRTVGASDTAARFGGDEFAVLMDGVASPQEVIDMSDRIVEEFGVPVRLEAQEVIVRPSIGIAIAGPTADGTPMVAEELVRDADAAMYMCKRDRKGGYRIFEPAMHARVHERLTLRIELQRAIELGQFELFFQPLIDLRTGAASGVEALCRWNHPTRGRVMPDEFIPLAEELGLIVDIGRWVLQEGCRQAVAFHATTPAVLPITLGVNISARQLQDPRIVDDVRDALRESGLDATRLILELTETVMMEDPELAAARINELRTLGARIAIDDFGTGYSSLSYLSRFPIDILKMDRSFLAPETPIHATGLAAAIVSLGATLGVEVVAEGIERPDQLAALRELGCDTGQGYLIGRPMDAEATGRWLREHLSEAPSDAMLAA